MSPDSLESRLKAEAARLGFSLCGIAPAAEAETFADFERWLDAGRAGGMDYLHKHRDARRHPASILAGVRSVVMLGIPYDARPHPDPLPPGHGKVARYARGPDYHDVIRDKLNALSSWLTQEAPESRSRGVIDTAPLLERDFARRAGLGWIGKNTMLIHPRQGSYLFLAALLTTLELKPDTPFLEHHCGTCTACLDACPTQAFPQPGTLDATKCISYWTIEHRGPIPLEMQETIGDWLFGCDVCQEVCPWNRFAGAGVLPYDEELLTIHCEEFSTMTDEEFCLQYRGTALMRSKLAGLKRNAAVVLSNRSITSEIGIQDCNRENPSR